MIKKTTEHFIKEAMDIHGDKYDYSKSVYKLSSEKITIICKKHGEFIQQPCKHLRGQGCPDCRYIKSSVSNKSSKLINKMKSFITEQPEDYKLIPLTKGNIIKVDNEDFEKLNSICWYNSKGYAYNKFIGLMHRLIMNCPEDMVVDHKNHDKLDNRKQNLRICTPQENRFNSNVSVTNKLGLKGIMKSSNNNYLAEITKNGIKYGVGTFTTEEEAVLAYNKKAIELFGEFARLNII